MIRRFLRRLFGYTLNRWDCGTPRPKVQDYDGSWAELVKQLKPGQQPRAK